MHQNGTFTVSEEERMKELFEYEMTEVLLQLKDEFKELSREDMDCAGVIDVPQVSKNISKVEKKKQKKVTIDTIEPLSVPNTSMPVEKKQQEKVTIDTIEPLSISNTSMAIEKKQQEKVTIDTIEPFKIADSSLDIVKKQVEEVKIDTIKPVDIPKVDIPKMDLSASEQSKKEYDELFVQTMKKYEILPDFNAELSNIFASISHEIKV